MNRHVCHAPNENDILCNIYVIYFYYLDVFPSQKSKCYNYVIIVVLLRIFDHIKMTDITK